MTKYKSKSIQKPSIGTVTLHIKNMVCDRCVRVVKEELEKLGLDVHNVVLGEAVVASRKVEPDRAHIRQVLRENGFDLLDSRNAQLVERIKTAIVKLVHYNHDEVTLKLKQSEYIARELGMDYPYLSSLFSSIEGITIEKYIILQKIERVKELLKYEELTLSEIADKLSYSSVQHLSNQFKQVTGFTPREFKNLTGDVRTSLDHVTESPHKAHQHH